MARTRLDLPTSFNFSTEISIRITDINYGGHAGNDSILSLIHEARMQFLLSREMDELGKNGPGLIMRDVTIEFRKEIFYGDQISVSVAATNFETASFDLFYKFERHQGEKAEIVVTAKTGMACFDYSRKRVVAIAPGMVEKLSGLNT